MYQQPNIIGSQPQQYQPPMGFQNPQGANVVNAFLPKLQRARSAGIIEEYIYDEQKPKKKLKEIKKVLLPEKKKFLFIRYGKKFNLKDRCIVCGTHHFWEAGDTLRPPIPLTEVTKGRPMRGTYCPKHASTFMQMEMLEQQVLAEEHGLEFAAFKPRMPKVLKSGPINNLNKADVMALTAAGWIVKPPSISTMESATQEAHRIVNEINILTEQLNYLMIQKGVEANGSKQQELYGGDNATE